MTFAQITNNIIVNTIVLDDTTLIPIFSEGYDNFIEIDSLTPIPLIGWYYDVASNTFWPPIEIYTYGMKLPALQEPGYQVTIMTNIEFGNQLITQLTADATAAGIYAAGQTAAFLSYLNQLYLFLQTGFLLDANDELTSLIADTSVAKTNLSPFVTNTLLNGYQTQLQSWLGL